MMLSVGLIVIMTNGARAIENGFLNDNVNDVSRV